MAGCELARSIARGSEIEIPITIQISHGQPRSSQRFRTFNAIDEAVQPHTDFPSTRPGHWTCLPGRGASNAALLSAFSQIAPAGATMGSSQGRAYSAGSQSARWWRDATHFWRGWDPEK